jgi:hypothetical protein
MGGANNPAPRSLADPNKNSRKRTPRGQVCTAQATILQNRDK